MIRINLLPVREAERQKSGRQFLILFVILLVSEAFVLFYVQSGKEAEYKDLSRQNASIARKVKRLKKKTSAVTKLKNEQKELEQQKAVLDSLVEGQNGPVKMLDELSRMLTIVDDPKTKLQMQARGWNPDWDPKRLWVDAFVEENRLVRIAGHARNNEDLAEFLERLNRSRHFVNVRLNLSTAVQLKALGDTRMVKYDISTLVIYGPADVKRLAAGTLGAAKK